MQQRLGGKMAVRRVAAGTAAVGRVGCNWEGVGARAAARRGSCGRRSAAAELPSTTRRALWTTAAPDRLAAVSRVRAAQSALMEATMLGEREGANGTVPMVGKVASIDAAAMRRVAPPVDVAGDSTPELRCAFGTRLRLGPWGSQSPEKARTKANDELCKDGANLHVNYVDSEQDAGADEPLVLMHGFGSGLGLFFSNYVGVGARERRVIGVDWLGMGGSGRPPFPRRPACSRAQDEAATVAASIAFFVDSLEAWRAAAGIPRMRLFGHSLGGYLAANYALTYPERVTRLVLAGPVGLPDAGEPADAPADQDLPLNLRLITGAWAHNVTPQAIVRALGPRGERMVQRAVAGRFRRSMADRPEEQALVADYLYHVTAAPPSGEYAMNALLKPQVRGGLPGVYARDPLASRLSSIECPTTIIFGDSDWLWHEDVPRLCRTLPDGSRGLRIVRDAGHHLYLDQPAAFHAEVLAAVA